MATNQILTNQLKKQVEAWRGLSREWRKPVTRASWDPLNTLNLTPIKENVKWSAKLPKPPTPGPLPDTKALPWPQGIDDSEFGINRSEREDKGWTWFRFSWPDSTLTDEDRERIKAENKEIADAKDRWDKDLEALLREQEGEKTRFEKRAAEQRELDALQRREATEWLRRAKSWFSSLLLSGWREGPVAWANIRWAAWATRWINRKIEIIDKQRALFSEQIDEKRRLMQRAQEAWQIELSRQISNEISWIQNAQNQLEFDKQTQITDAETELTNNIIEDAIEIAWDSFWTFSDEDLFELSQTTWVPLQILKARRDADKAWWGKAWQEKQLAQLNALRDFAKSWLLADMWADQASAFDTNAWLPKGTTAALVLWAQAARKWDKSERETNLLKTLAEISKIEAWIETDALDLILKERWLNIDLWELTVKQREALVKEYEAWLTDINQLNVIPTALKRWDMNSSKNTFKVVPSIKGSETSKIWDWNIILWSKHIFGLDMDWTDWQELFAPQAIHWWTIKEINSKDDWTKTSNWWFWVNVVIEDINWKEWRFSHLQKWSLKWFKADQEVEVWDLIWKIWTTWNVEPWPNWDWSYVDITVKQFWEEVFADEVERFINAWFTNVKKLNKRDESTLSDVTKEFRSIEQVKSFEEALTQWETLLASLRAENWPWDMAAVFQFMKTLDPRSTVRWEEFDLAARSAWLEWFWLWFWENFFKWKKLAAPWLRKKFWELASEYVKIRSKDYQNEYDLAVNKLNRQQIPSILFPSNKADRALALMGQVKWIDKIIEKPTDSSDEEKAKKVIQDIINKRAQRNQ